MMEGVLTAGRLAAESLMLDTCRVSRGSGTPVWDEESGTYTPAAATVVYEGRCRVKPPTVSVRSVAAGEQELSVVPGRLDLPIDSEDYREAEGKRLRPTDGDAVEIIAAGSLSGIDVGSRFTVEGPNSGSLTTARRLPIVEVVSRG